MGEGRVISFHPGHDPSVKSREKQPVSLFTFLNGFSSELNFRL